MDRRALCVGIDEYPDTGVALEGCINDAHDWAQVLRRYGYHVTMLIDDVATVANIEEAVCTLVRDAGQGDRLVLTYSGFGASLPGPHPELGGGRCPVLCTFDCAQGRVLAVGRLAQLLGPNPVGAHVYVVLDTSCAGTVIPLDQVKHADGRSSRARARCLPRNASFVLNLAAPPGFASGSGVACTPWSELPGVVMSACDEGQVSFEDAVDGRMGGVFTRAAIDALRNTPDTPAEWLRSIQEHLLTHQYVQIPRLFGSPDSWCGPML